MRVLGLPDGIAVCLFDLDGVLTDTASVHRRAWKTMFDDYLAQRAKSAGEPFREFSADSDYPQYVDGKTRDDGVRSFLQSRGITLPDGDPDDDSGAESVHGLANRKNDLFQISLHRDGVEVFDGSRRYLEAVTDVGLPVAVVSSSANTEEVLRIADLEKFVQCRVDGVTIRTENLPGKPAPDTYLRAAQLLHVEPAHAAVFEDALSGVQAGRAGHFGVVVGVDRIGHAEALRDNGADIVVKDLADLLAPR
ncbi:beta-phosphoglucomutase family hydrolase [Mycolicibacterium komossense]|uniref:Beta-phosphoglucomutase n=1 Tax=Mycolicibacterium komossense TaxID=1779 RepID=A0ABT3CEJ8_9MYCO|nr:beta-phosphoglucomutase family hydrolase [Mycolicibacterium komossense]MCV7227912.1 beta-phosphoglucomutase family hydrolase [Mycolicibacterium komossense]